MPDTIGALAKKKAKLVEWKRKVRKDAERQIVEIDRQIADLDKAIDLVNEAVKDILCPTCHGCGTVRHCDAAGDMEDATCPTCKGTGVKI